jgi:hypothetical protein
MQHQRHQRSAGDKSIPMANRSNWRTLLLIFPLRDLGNVFPNRLQQMDDIGLPAVAARLPFTIVLVVAGK